MNATEMTQERILGTVHMVNEYTGAERDILVDFIVDADLAWVDVVDQAVDLAAAKVGLGSSWSYDTDNLRSLAVAS